MPSAIRFSSTRFAWPDGRRILDGFDLDVRAGEITALVGPSGCGKSTLLRLAAGLERAEAGAVEITEKRPAFVFQSPTLLAWRSARRNVALPLELQGAVDEAAVDRALAQVGLSEAADKLPHQLSGGMRMRVSLARALVTEPRLMLLDEPFSALDALTRARVHEQFLALWRRLGFTGLMVTHDVDEAVYLADRIVVLQGPPLRITMDLAVPLERPRAPSLRHDPRLGAQVEAVIDALEAAP